MDGAGSLVVVKACSFGGDERKGEGADEARLL
jgi:hypothetical protein